MRIRWRGVRQGCGLLLRLCPLLLLSCGPRLVGAGKEHPGEERKEAESETMPRGDESQEAESETASAREGGQQERFALLALDGFQSAVLRLPRTSREGGARLFVAAHGAGGRAIEHCRFWDERLDRDVLIACPEGKLLRTSDPEAGAYYPDHLALRRELEALFRALRSSAQEPRFPHLSPEKAVYFGYSQGATMGALALVGESADFSHLVLVEGGGESWSVSRGLSFKAKGGEGVLLACGTKGCSARLTSAGAALTRAGLQARLVNVPGGGHAYWGEVGAQTTEALRGFLPAGYLPDHPTGL